MFCTTTRGQIITSTILGHVSDSSGAAVPGAQVTVTNQGTSLSSTIVTDSAGDYSVSGLEPGVYMVVVTQKGFETSRTTGIQLLSSENQRVDATLKVGSTTQVVTVTGEKVTMLHTDTVTVGTTFTNQQLSELPLANDTIDSLDKIVPGWAFGQSLSNGRVNGGTYWGSLNYTINGAENNDQSNGGQPYANGGYAIGLPQPESFQEFRVDSMNTNAEFARTTTITMVTRSGTNQFHGDLQELYAGAVLSANAFTNDGAIPKVVKPGYVRNQMGINLGGPIKRDRAFFFLNWSELLSRSYTPENLVMPSLAMDQGNFGALCSGTATFNSSGVCSTASEQLYNPLNGQPFANNVIPTSMFAAQSKLLLGFLPAPNILTAGLPSGPTDFVTQNRAADDVGVTNDRLDFKLTDKDMLYATYWREGAPVYLQAQPYPQTYGQDEYPPTNTGYTLAETHTFGPTAVNELRYSWFDREVVEVGINLGFNPQTELFPQLQNSYNRGLPTMSITGYTGMFHDIGNLPHSHNPAIEFTDNYSKVHGRHTLKFGADELGTKTYGRAGPGALGTFTFNTGAWTAGKGWAKAGVTPSAGSTFADFLLGDAQATTYTPPSTFGSNQYTRIWSLYGQDTFQATSHLTIYYGLRYEVQQPWWYQVNGGVGISSYYNLATNQLALPTNSSTVSLPPIDASSVQFNAYNTPTACAPAPSCFTTTQALGLPIRWMQTPTKNFGPRLGFAYRPFHGSNNTVVRAGFGIYYDQLNDPWSTMAGNTPWLGNAAPGLTFSSALSGTPPATGYQPDLTFANPFPGSGTLSAASAHPTISYVPRNYTNGMVKQWNLTLEHQFAGQWLGQITYFGDQAHHIVWWASNIDIPTTMQSGVALQTQLPEQPWAAINSYRSGGKSNFEELQIQMTKRMASGLMVQAYYTYAHSLDNVEGSSTTTEPADWHNPDLDYGNTVFVRRQTFNIAYLYELPFGRGKHFLPGANRFLNGVVGGWEWSGDTVYGSGMPFDITFAVPAADVGWFGQNTAPAVANRANVVPGQALYTGQNKHSHNIIAGVPWYNQSAFAAPAPYTWGNSARNELFGPGWGDWDMALLKNFSLPWQENMKLQFRIEAYNVANHFNLGNPGSISSEFGSYVQIPAAGITPSPTQGMITSCYPNCTVGGPYGQGNRYFQVGARLFF
jgi:hypothetical protein